jgi:hypothetical protein
MSYRYRNPANYDCADDFYSDVEADADAPLTLET